MLQVKAIHFGHVKMAFCFKMWTDSQDIWKRVKTKQDVSRLSRWPCGSPSTPIPVFDPPRILWNRLILAQNLLRFVTLSCPLGSTTWWDQAAQLGWPQLLLFSGISFPHNEFSFLYLCRCAYSLLHSGHFCIPRLCVKTWCPSYAQRCHERFNSWSCLSNQVLQLNGNTLFWCLWC